MEKNDFCVCSMIQSISLPLPPSSLLVDASSLQILSFSFRFPSPPQANFFSSYDCVKFSQSEDVDIFSLPSATTPPPSILSREALIGVIVGPSVVVLLLVIVSVIVVSILVCGKKNKRFV